MNISLSYAFLWNELKINGIKKNVPQSWTHFQGLDDFGVN